MNTESNIKHSLKNDFNEKIFSPESIRFNANKIADICKLGGTHFSLHENLLPAAADFVIEVIRERYPDLNVPYHSRWRHFEVGNHAQLNAYNEAIKDNDTYEKARIGLDLIIPSVLVDAGAGAKWQYSSLNSVTVGRSEGLGIASLDAFLSGAFSETQGLGSDAVGLQNVNVDSFNHLFKISDANPMLGVDGRVGLLNSLGETLAEKSQFFKNKRPGDLVDYILSNYGTEVSAQQILQLILQSLGDIWPGRLEHNDINLGDTWAYEPFGIGFESYVPFHKLSQWISYSVIETLEKNGFTVTNLNELTGLAEYRNGGLMLDFGLLKLRDESNANKSWQPSSDLIIEWRALTIYLLDSLCELIQKKLNLTSEQFPLAKILEGGTWAAGRKLASIKRENSEPPINILSDGTVF